MELRQLNYFLTLCKYRNYSKAAKELFIAQPTLSQQIFSLEKNLGLTLINHSQKSFQLTETGEAFLELATRFMDKYANFVEDVEDLKQLQKLSLRFASLNAVNAMYTPNLLSAFTHAHPDIKIIYSTTYFYNLVSFVQEQLIDISIALIYSEKSYQNLGTIMLNKQDDDLVLVIPNQSPYIKANTYEEAAESGLLFQTCYLFEGWKDYDIPLKIIKDTTGLSPAVSYYNNLIEFLSQPYSWQTGYTILPRHYLEFIQSAPLFKTIFFPEGACKLDCVLLYNPGNNNPASKIFIEEFSDSDIPTSTY